MSLRFKEVCYSYDKGPVLKKITFSLNKKEIVGLIGENGAGKTTVILNAIKILTPNSGEILIPPSNTNIFPITYIPDEFIFYEELTVIEHLEFVRIMYKKNQDDVQQLIEMFELSEHLNKIPYELSKGTKQKLMISCALLRDFDYILADEPFEGLDPKQLTILKKKLIEQKSKGKGVLISTHLLNLVEDICDRYIILHKGIILAEGTKSQIQAKFGVKDLNLEKTYISILEKS